MRSLSKTTFFCRSALAFAGIPLLIWALGDTHTRSLILELFSGITILAFCQMIVLCFWSRAYAYAVEGLKMNTLIKWHKIIGYTCISLMLFHPLLLVAPTFFNGGLSPVDAFVTIITTPNQGVILGISAWICMVILLLTAYSRSRLPMKYTTWRVFHGILALLTIILGTCHALDLGRTVTQAMAYYIFLLAGGAVLLITSRYIAHPDTHYEKL